MLCLGLSGGLSVDVETLFELPHTCAHDGAAALVEDGEVVTAYEEERLNRIKHSNVFPVEATHRCLEYRDIEMNDIDYVAYYATEEYCDAVLANLQLTRDGVQTSCGTRTTLQALLERAFRCSIDPAQIIFVPHHTAHATSAFALSGFEQSLVLVIDGCADFRSGVLAVGDGNALEEIEVYPESKSLGLLYLDVIRFLGYGLFDEYKVMGLAPYGNPTAYRSIFHACVDLLPDGQYDLHRERLVRVLSDRVAVRAHGQPFKQEHRDLAAGLQEILEKIVFHVLTHHRQTLRHTSLCMAGGVALNCTMNGKVLRSGLFDDVFVQPAAHDAGCAIGAALAACKDCGRPPKRSRLKHVYFGTDIGSQRDIAGELERWRNLVTFNRSSNVAQRAADLLAEGAVVAWVQGRSEFGPRALGNRSILADPRPAENTTRINQLVKKRETYRPFAPSVLEEDAGEYFELPDGCESLPFMTFVVNVRKEQRALLGAITHVDGTARIQTVSRETNPRYWELIKSFKDRAGIPVLLNTSFNNQVEPIVDSIEDAVVCFLTTGIDCLVVGDYVVTKLTAAWHRLLVLRLSIPSYVQLERRQTRVAQHEVSDVSQITTSHGVQRRISLSNSLYDLLVDVQDERPLGELLERSPMRRHAKALVSEVEELWAQRMIRLRPPTSASRPR